MTQRPSLRCRCFCCQLQAGSDQHSIFQLASRCDTSSAGLHPTTACCVLQRRLEKWICSNKPWLVLHKIDSPAKMSFMGQRFAECPGPPSAAGPHGDTLA